MTSQRRSDCVSHKSAADVRPPQKNKAAHPLEVYARELRKSTMTKESVQVDSHMINTFFEKRVIVKVIWVIFWSISNFKQSRSRTFAQPCDALIPRRISVWHQSEDLLSLSTFKPKNVFFHRLLLPCENDHNKTIKTHEDLLPVSLTLAHSELLKVQS